MQLMSIFCIDSDLIFVFMLLENQPRAIEKRNIYKKKKKKKKGPLIIAGSLETKQKKKLNQKVRLIRLH